MSNDSIDKHVKSIIEEIAAEEGYTDYRIITKIQEFTGDNYIGNITRIEIKPSDATKSLHLIVKTAMDSLQLRERMPVAKFYKNETYSYTTVLPAVQETLEKNGIPSASVIRFAKFYRANSEDCKEAIIMKDMCREGYVLHDKRKPFSHEQAEIVIKTVAQLHAATFVMKERDPELYSELSNNVPHTNNYSSDLSHLPQSIQSFTKHIKCPVTKEKVNDFAEVSVEKLIDVLDSKFTEPYNVICHGDCWNNNMLFKYEGGKPIEVVLIDWQVIRIASPAMDLSYMMFMSMDAEYLETHLESLLDLYYVTLQYNLSTMGLDINKCYPKEIFTQHVKRSMIYGFIMAIFGLPIILVDSKDAQTIENVLNETKNGNDISLPVNDLAKKRYRNVINYFVNRGLI